MTKFNIKTILFILLQCSYGIVQTFIGLGIFIYLLPAFPSMFFYHGAIVTRWQLKGSLSLGLFIFLGHHDHKILVHEYGHSIQSLLLGPAYLFLIGIPSFLWAYYPRNQKYYSFYTEKNANYFGKKILKEDVPE